MRNRFECSFSKSVRYIWFRSQLNHTRNRHVSLFQLRNDQNVKNQPLNLSDMLESNSLSLNLAKHLSCFCKYRNGDCNMFQTANNHRKVWLKMHSQVTSWKAIQLKTAYLLFDLWIQQCITIKSTYGATID